VVLMADQDDAALSRDSAEAKEARTQRKTYGDTRSGDEQRLMAEQRTELRQAQRRSRR
jgi:hypothetical protein